MTGTARLAAAAAVLLATLPALAPAHHSLTGNFLMEAGARETLRGVLLELDWRSPHVVLTVEVTRPDGGTRVYRLESYPSTYFEHHGFAREDFSRGAPLAVEIYPARNSSSHSGWARIVHFPDGRTLAPVTGESTTTRAERAR